MNSILENLKLFFILAFCVFDQWKIYFVMIRMFSFAKYYMCINGSYLFDVKPAPVSSLLRDVRSASKLRSVVIFELQLPASTMKTTSVDFGCKLVDNFQKRKSFQTYPGETGTELRRLHFEKFITFGY
ncbi:Protein of unknown function [Gryllus bimaculatus]|nr:Protein of unknown function [Gryllus bimaculatus]